MKRRLSLIFASLLLALVCVHPATPQNTIPGPGGVFAWQAIAATGAAAPYLDYHGFEFSPSTYTVDWSNDGTAATVCAFYPQGSSDAVHWNMLATSDPTGDTMTPFDCTTQGSFVVVDKPVAYFRILVVTYTPADNTTAVRIRYTRGR